MTAKKADKFLDKHPDFAAKQCAERYPIIEKTDTVSVVDSVLINAYESELFLLWKQLDNVLSAGCDTQYITRIKEIIKTKPAKPETKYIIKTQESTAKLDTLRIASIRREAILIKDNTDCNAELKKLEDKIIRKNKWILWLWIVIITLSIYTLRRQIFKLIRPI